MSDVIINIENLKKTYIGPPKVEVLKSLSLQVYKNEILAITGESGSGKTTLLNQSNRRNRQYNRRYYKYCWK